MSLINTEVKPFNATAYHNGQFIEIEKTQSSALGFLSHRT